MNRTCLLSLRDVSFRTLFVVLLTALLMIASGVGAFGGATEARADERSSTGAGDQKHGKVSRKPNRLINEKSPYLLQHAYNPVDWFPWGAEAFETARRENKPVFLSIGYSTCHWCHVMERESFEDDEIAAYLNEHFVAIKVDREERPDVDGVYMDAVTAIIRRGGWPLSAFLLPNGKPFYGGTYFPPRDHPTRGVGFLTLCQKVVSFWTDKRSELEVQAERLTDHLKAQAEQLRGMGPLKPEVFRTAYGELKKQFDPRYGGFRGPPHQPKFPRTSVLDFLLRYSVLPEAEADGSAKEARRMVLLTLDHMIDGGIRDHLAGGFHRYSVDRVWLIPHFEKMLYDQALIARTLVDAARVSGNSRYLLVAQETLDYVLGRMTGPDGEIYSAEDADTEGVEGLTYSWRREEVLNLLGAARGAQFGEYYGVTASGNFEEGGHQVNVLHVTSPRALEGLAKKAKKDVATIENELKEDRLKLLTVRDKRAQPLRDDKVLTAWNGLAVSALALTYQLSGEKKYLQGAQRSANFVLTRMKVDGKLMRRFRDGDVLISGFLNDYAFFIDGLLDLYEADFDSRWLEEAVSLARTLLGLFWDSERGGFYSSGSHQEKLIARQKEFYDGAIPSGNSVAFGVLHRLVEFTGSEDFSKPADQMSRLAATLFSGAGGGGASRYPALLCGAYYRLRGARELMIVGDRQDSVTVAMLSAVHGRFLPNKVVVYVESAEAATRLSKLVPLAEGKMAIGGKPTGFVCKQGVCKLPARDVETFAKQLDAGN